MKRNSFLPIDCGYFYRYFHSEIQSVYFSYNTQTLVDSWSFTKYSPQLHSCPFVYRTLYTVCVVQNIEKPNKLFYLEVVMVFLLETLRLSFAANGWRQTQSLFAIKTKSLTVKCIAYRIYSKYRKLRIETPCLTAETWRLILNDFLLT